MAKSAKAQAAEYRVKRRKILEIFAQGGTVRQACASAGIGRSTYYDWRREDPEFARLADEALEDGADVWEEEVARRAFDGVEKPVFYQGGVCGYIREYSDTLAALMVKARRPHKFRDNVTLAGGDGGPVQVEVIKRVVVDPKKEGSS